MILTLSTVTLVNTYLLGFVKVILTLLVVLSGRELTPIAWRNAIRSRVGMAQLPLEQPEPVLVERDEVREAA